MNDVFICFHKNTHTEPAILDDTPKRCFGQACLQGFMFNFVAAVCRGFSNLHFSSSNQLHHDGHLKFHLPMTANPLSLNHIPWSPTRSCCVWWSKGYGRSSDVFPIQHHHLHWIPTKGSGFIDPCLIFTISLDI